MMKTPMIATAIGLSALCMSAQAQFSAAQPTPTKVPGVTVPSAAGSYQGGPDACTSAHDNAGTGGVSGVPWDTTAATTGTTGQAEALCYAFGTSGIQGDVWFRWTSDGTASNATLTMCGGTSVDTKVASYLSAGTSTCPAPGALACNDDSCGLQSSITWAVTASTTYTLQIGSFPGATQGSGTFDIIQTAPPPCGAKDDGSTENALGLTAGGEIGWIKVVTCDLLTHDSISTAYGTLMFPGSVTNGNTSQLVIYTSAIGAIDPNDPSWVTTTKVNSVVVNGDTDILNKTAVGTRNRAPNTTTMVLASADQVAGQFPAPMDQAIANPDAWVVGSTLGPGTLNTTTLTANNVPPTNMTAIGFPSTFLLRLENTGGGGGPGTQTCFGATTCPCGNNSTSGGCSNGAPMPPGQGAILTASGSNSIAADDLVLTAMFTTNQPGLFFQGDVTINGGNGVAFGDGLRCCGTNVIRLEIVDPPGPNGPSTAQTAQPIIGTSPPGTIVAGVKQCYQWWYRNPNRSLCGSNFNLSNAVTVTWTP